IFVPVFSRALSLSAALFLVAQLPLTAAPISTLFPANGIGLGQLFTITVSDALGSNNVSHVQLMIGPSLNTTNSCLVQYDPIGRTLQLLNDSGGAFAGPIAIGTAGTLQNSQCIVDTGLSTATPTSGTSFTVGIAVAF